MSESATTKSPTEVIPSIEGEASAIASAHAPFIYIDGVITQGFANGIGNMTLEAIRHGVVGGKVVTDRVVVAHLRMGVIGLQSIKAACEAMLLQMLPVENPEGKAN
jgi:hypothetical protein